MGGVKVSSDDDILALLMVQINNIQQTGIKLQFEGYALIFLAAIREVDVVKKIIRVT